jgi:superfamily II DNA or RNA helicase
VELRPYQRQAIDASRRAVTTGVTRQLIVMATGLGKTVTVAALLKELGLPRTFAVAHREELLHQAASTIDAWAPGQKIGYEKAGQVADPTTDNVILASIQTVGRKDRSRLSRFLPTWPGVVWVDETHHAPASSYLEVLDHFGVYGDTPRRDCIVLGTTATPDRLDELGYDKIFDDVVFRYDLRDAIRDKWLADIRAWRCTTDLDLGKVKSRAGDFVQGQLADAIERSDLDQVFLRTWKEKCRLQPSLVYCVDKAHAGRVFELLKTAGAKAAMVVDDTPPSERKAAIMAFKAGDLEAIVNVAVLTEGFDAPNARHIHILRPTKSRTLYTQILGRGTRKDTGKEFVEVYDYTEQEHDVCAVGRIFGLPDSWLLTGQSVTKDADEVEELEAELGLDAEGAKTVSDFMRTVKRRRVELIKGSLSDTGLPGRFAWVRPSPKVEKWSLSWRLEDRGDARVPPQVIPLIDKLNAWGQPERIEIFRNELGLYEAKIVRGGTGGKLYSDRSLTKLVDRVEKLIEEKRPHKIPLLRKDAKWGKAPASEKQVEVLKRKGVPDWALDGLNKREASMLIVTPASTIKSWFKEESHGEGKGTAGVQVVDHLERAPRSVGAAAGTGAEGTEAPGPLVE